MGSVGRKYEKRSRKMKIVLVEPLTIDKEILANYKKSLEDAGHEFISYDSKPQSEDDWLQRTAGAQQIILANSKMPASVLENENLKYINVAFTGLDHIPLKEAEEKGIRVTNAAGYSDQAVAELTLGLVISLLRKIKGGDQGIRKGGKAADFLGCEIAGRTVGIVGTGHIGKRVAELFKALGAKLIGYNRSQKEDVKALGLEYVSKEKLLQEADIISVHLPNTQETRDFFTYEDFKKMKKEAILINCARGPIVNSKDLARALEEGEIAGAGVDVYNQEPPLTDEPLLNAPNALLTPHIAYFTKEAMLKRAKIVFENALKYAC